MSKETPEIVPVSSGPIPLAYAVWSWEVSNIEGKLLTIVESIGLQERQEKAVKDLVSQALWHVIDRPYRDCITGNEIDAAKASRLGSSSAKVGK